MLLQGVLSMLFCANALMRHFTPHTFSGCFDFAPKTHGAKISFTRSAQHDSADGKLALYFLVNDATDQNVPVCICHFERSALCGLFITLRMGAESKNPGPASFSMLHQGVLSMLFRIWRYYVNNRAPSYTWSDVIAPPI